MYVVFLGPKYTLCLDICSKNYTSAKVRTTNDLKWIEEITIYIYMLRDMMYRPVPRYMELILYYPKSNYYKFN